MMNNIIVSGCSYSSNSDAVPYPIHIKNSTDYNVTNLSWPGQGNESIIRKIKEQIRSGVENTTFICQLSYLHRKSYYCNIIKDWIDFQPAVINPSPQNKKNIKFEIDFNNKPYSSINQYGKQRRKHIRLTQDVYKKLIEWYHDYLFFIYDEESVFNELMFSIDELTKQVLDSNNKILYLYWPTEIFDMSIINKNNFLEIDGEYSMLNWSVKNNLTNNKDTHLSTNGHLELTKIILNKLGITQTKEFTLL